MSVDTCPVCGAVHHSDCWQEGGGCAVVGCAGAAATAATVATPQRAVATGQPATPAAPPGPHRPSVAAKASGSGRSGGTLAVAVIVVAVAMLGVAVGVLAASGALSASSQGATTIVKTQAATGPSQARSTIGLLPAEETSKREAVMKVLDEYQRDYSQRSIRGLDEIFSRDIHRHGLNGEGQCTIANGRPQVLEIYAQQFSNGTGTYRLVGLEPSQIRLNSAHEAYVHANYEISPGGSGFVDFRLEEIGNEWLVTEVYATCA